MDDGPEPPNDQRSAVLKTGEAMIGGLMPIPEHAEGVPPAWMGYVAVDDVAACAEKGKAAGGVIHRGPSESLMSAHSPSPAIRTARHSGCSRGRASAPPDEPSGLGQAGWRELRRLRAPRAEALSAAAAFPPAQSRWKGEPSWTPKPLG